MKQVLIFCMLFLVMTSSFAESKVAFLVADDGTKYDVLNKQNLLFKGDKMLVITYLSADPHIEKVRNKEFQDLYQITADNINPSSEYDYIALVAMEKRNKTFGITKNSGYRDRRKFSEVIALRKNES
jgi:hypothetical protein